MSKAQNGINLIKAANQWRSIDKPKNNLTSHSGSVHKKQSGLIIVASVVRSGPPTPRVSEGPRATDGGRVCFEDKRLSVLPRCTSLWLGAPYPTASPSSRVAREQFFLVLTDDSGTLHRARLVSF